MKKSVQLIFLIPVLAFAFSCGRQIDCPEFTGEVLEWVPYGSNDTIPLINPANDSTLFLVVNEIDVEHTSHYMTNQKCGSCDDQVSVNSALSDSDLQVFILLNENTILSQTFIVKGVYFTDDNSACSELSDYTFNNHLFEAMRIFDRTGSGEKYTKLYVAKHSGIVGLVDDLGNTWSLPEEELNSIGNGPLEIRSIACE